MTRRKHEVEAELERTQRELRDAREVARCEASLRLRWEQRTEEARAELRSLLSAVTSLNDDDGPRAAAIQHARAVLEDWGMR